MNRYRLSKAVQKRLEDLDLTAEDVIKKALGMNNEGWTDPATGIHFPEGTVFLAYYKDNAVSAIVKEGALTIKDKTFTALSASAAHYTGRPTQNGWDFWSVKYPGGNIVSAHDVRAQHLEEETKGGKKKTKVA